MLTSAHQLSAYLLALSCCLIPSYSETKITEAYGADSGGEWHDLYDQGKIYAINDWGYRDDESTWMRGLKIRDWDAESQSEDFVYGTGATHGPCPVFNLSSDDFIVGYKMWIEPTELRPCRLQLYTRSGDMHGCSAPQFDLETASAIYEEQFDSGGDNFWYLTGWHIKSGANIDTLGFQFTKYIPAPTTPLPSNNPTRYPTNNPSSLPTQVITIRPTLHPINKATLFYAPTVETVVKTPVSSVVSDGWGFIVGIGVLLCCTCAVVWAGCSVHRRRKRANTDIVNGKKAAVTNTEIIVKVKNEGKQLQSIPVKTGGEDSYSMSSQHATVEGSASSKKYKLQQDQDIDVVENHPELENGDDEDLYVIPPKANTKETDKTSKGTMLW